MKFPKEWLEAVENSLVWLDDAPSKQHARGALEALHNVGALKDPPEPREFWVSVGPNGAMHICEYFDDLPRQSHDRRFKVREVEVGDE